MKEFIERFPGHDQFSVVENYYNTLRDERKNVDFLTLLMTIWQTCPRLRLRSSKS